MEMISTDYFFLSKVQIVTVMGLAEADGQGMVDVPKFLRTSQDMIFRLMDSQKTTDKAAAIENLAKTEGAMMLHGMSGDEVKTALQGAFQAVDTEEKGWLTPDQVYDVLQMMGTGELGLSGAEINSLLASVDENDDGVVEWEELVDFVWDVLLHLDRDQVVAEIADDNAAFDADEEG